MSFARIALKNLQTSVSRYYSSEIDRHALVVESIFVNKEQQNTDVQKVHVIK